MFSRCSCLLVAPLLLLGCETLLGEDPPTKPKPKPGETADAAESGGGGSGDAGAAEAPPEPLVRAERKMRFGAIGGERMGFAMAKLSRVRALAGAIEVPEWSAQGSGAPRLTRDDNMRTAWVCDPTEEKSCAIGIHFPQPTDLEIVRMYAATPEKGDYSRPKRVRIHTKDGWAESRFDDGDHPWHMVLGEPINTRNITVEILETHGDGPVHLAEIEFYGNGGVARRPLSLDLGRRVITFDKNPWSSKSRTHSPRTAFVEQVDVDGRLQRLFPGTAVVGKPGDRLVTIEHFDWTACDGGQGTYEVLDLQTRVFLPVGDFGRFGAPMYPHSEGLGLAVGTLDADSGSVQAVVVDDDHYEHRLSNRLSNKEPKELLTSWSFVATPLSRSDAHTLDDPPAGCSTARLEHLDALRPHLGKREKIVADEWYGCSLGGGVQALLTTGGDCGKQWKVVVLDEEGELLGETGSKEPGTHIRMRRLDAETLLVELWGKKDQPQVLRVDIDGPNPLKESAAFSLRPPAGCRKTCAVDFEDLGGDKK